MARSIVRTARMSLDVINRMLNLFGSIKNAHRQLGLEGILPYQAVYTAFHFLPIKPDIKDKIEDAWSRWQLIYLRPEVPISDQLALTPETLAKIPRWVPRPKSMGKARATA